MRKVVDLVVGLDLVMGMGMDSVVGMGLVVVAVLGSVLGKTASAAVEVVGFLHIAAPKLGSFRLYRAALWLCRGR